MTIETLCQDCQQSSNMELIKWACYYTDEASWDTWTAVRDALASPACWDDFKATICDMYPIHEDMPVPLLPTAAPLPAPAPLVLPAVSIPAPLPSLPNLLLVSAMPHAMPFPMPLCHCLPHWFCLCCPCLLPWPQCTLPRLP